MSKIDLPAPYKHDPKIEPRPYWRVDRFHSSLTGYVHYFGFPTGEPFRHLDQLMEKWEPTEKDLQAQRDRDKETKEYRERVRKAAMLQGAFSEPVQGEAQPDRKPRKAPDRPEPPRNRAKRSEPAQGAQRKPKPTKARPKPIKARPKPTKARPKPIKARPKSKHGAPPKTGRKS